MAEMVIRVAPAELSGNPDVDRKRQPQGAVLDILPDGHPFSDAERKNPNWAIIKFPGVKVSALMGYMACDPEYKDDQVRTGRRWRFVVDIAELTKGGGKVEGVIDGGLSKAVALQKTRTDTFHDPIVIGEETKVIG